MILVDKHDFPVFIKNAIFDVLTGKVIFSFAENLDFFSFDGKT